VGYGGSQPSIGAGSANGYRLMDEEYTNVSPFVLWRRRLLVAAMIIAFLSLVWGSEVLYDSWRVNSGANAWFMVRTPVTRNQPYAASESVFSDGYATERDCNKALNQLPSVYGAPVIVGCRRLLLYDAAKMRRY
jgi:hypothetical protein